MPVCGMHVLEKWISIVGYVDYDKGQLGMSMCLSVRLEQLFNGWPRIE